ncbi:MAG: TIGR00282 family metallophosphoesterase [Candidatus Omnitrophota bacterium]
MKILFIGDIVGSPGRKAIKELLPKIKNRENIDFVIANCENAAGGSGITGPTADELFKNKIDVLTSGDHIWKKKEIVERIDADTRILRPANYPSGSPGFGAAVFESRGGVKIGVVNLIGRIFMQALDCPFKAAKQEIARIKDAASVIIVDVHAEATSEKIALGWYLDGLVSAVLGTHTHVQTADEKILPEGTAFISDVGMTGPFDSVIGRKKEQVLTRFITQMPARFEMAENDIQLHGVVIDIDENSGKARSILRIQEKLEAI